MDAEIKQKSAVYCNDLAGLIQHVIQQRRLNDNYHLIFGIDGGKNFFKVCLSIQYSHATLGNSNFHDEGITNPKRQKYSEGIGIQDLKDAGIKKLFILAAFKFTQECYRIVIDI